MPEIAFPKDLATRAIGDLIAYAKNPRTHTKDQVKQIADSIKEFGFNNPVLIDPKGEVIAGHGRILAAELLKLEHAPVVELPHLSETQKKAYRIADNRIALSGGWSIELLRLEFEALTQVDFNVDLLGFTTREMHRYLPPELFPHSNIYESEKFESPIYVPSGDQPALAELYDMTKANELIAAIEAAQLPKDLKTFLRFAAYRHIVFDYSKIAEYYAHASELVQGLMEDSALVIIDLDKAIEGGFVSMTKQLAEIAGQDEDDADDDEVSAA